MALSAPRCVRVYGSTGTARAAGVPRVGPVLGPVMTRSTRPGMTRSTRPGMTRPASDPGPASDLGLRTQILDTGSWNILNMPHLTKSMIATIIHFMT